MISREELRVSWLYQDGLAEGKRAAIRLALGQKFPKLQAAPEIDDIDRSDVLDELFLAIFRATNADDALTAIRAASLPN